MENIPPPAQPGFVAYPRGVAYDVSSLRTLSRAYFGLSGVFVLNLLLILGVNIFSNFALGTLVQNSSGTFFLVLGCGVLTVALITGTLTYQKAKLIGEVLGWNKGQAIGFSILTGLLCWFCFGAVGFVVLQGYASKAMQQRGIKMGFFITRKKIERQIDALEQQYSSIP